MSTVYKLTDENLRTHNHFLWTLGEKRQLTPCENPQICTNQLFHAYSDPVLGLLMNQNHANFTNPRLFEAVGKVIVAEWDKVGCFDLTLIKEIPLPEWYVDCGLRRRVCVQFAILCAEAVLPVFEIFNIEDNRPQEAVQAAKDYLACETAAYAADAYAAAAYAAAAATYAVRAAAAAYAAAAYAAAVTSINITALAHLAVKIIAGVGG